MINIITSDLGCEVAFTALARFLIGSDAKCYNIALSDLIKVGTLEREIDPSFRTIIMGNYRPDYVGPQVLHITFQEESPCSALIAELEKVGTFAPAVNFAIKQHTRALQTIDLRSRSKATVDTQPFVTGLHNSLPDDPLENKFYKLFTGVLDYDDIVAIGNTIVSSQMQVAHERALKNARSGTFRDGTSYVVTDGPEFVNMTHDELHKVFPEAKVTLVASLKFSPRDEDHVAHSLRSWSPAVDVKAMISDVVGSGGSPTAAGCRHTVNVRLDY